VSRNRCRSKQGRDRSVAPSPYWVRSEDHVPSADGTVGDPRVIAKEKFENSYPMVARSQVSSSVRISVK